jgi:hypothetical protein
MEFESDYIYSIIWRQSEISIIISHSADSACCFVNVLYLSGVKGSQLQPHYYRLYLELQYYIARIAIEMSKNYYIDWKKKIILLRKSGKY